MTTNEISIDRLVLALTDVLNNGRISSDADWEATADAITILKRVKRLEVAAQEPSTWKGQMKDSNFEDVVEFLKTGREVWRDGSA